MKDITISVIVPIKNAEDTITKCVESLVKQTYKAHEIILVDNKSTDDTYLIINQLSNKYKDAHIIILQESKPGSYAARNRGIQEATGDIIAFTDADCIADIDWLNRLVAGYVNGKIGGVAGRTEGYKPSGVIQKFLSLVAMPNPDSDSNFQEFVITEGGFRTCNVSFRRNILSKLNGFDDNMISGGDYDMCRRIYEAGYQIKYTNYAIINHIHRNDLEGMLKQNFRYGIWHPMLIKKKKGAIIFEIPAYRYQKFKTTSRIWINLNSLDKKFLFGFILGIIYWPLFILLTLYLLRQFIALRNRAQEKNISLSFGENIFIIPLLILKDAALTLGRIFGSIKHKVICI